jgi:outer membrane protein assembly factor BamB
MRRRETDARAARPLRADRSAARRARRRWHSPCSARSLSDWGSSPTPQPSSPSPSASPTPSHPVTLRVVDADSGRPLSGVRLAVPTLAQTVTTGEDGTATVEARKARQSLRIVPAKRGYSTYPLIVRPTADGSVGIDLFTTRTQWMTNGHGATRTRTAPGLRLGLPGKLLWKTEPQGMLEFPATLAYGLAFYNSQRNYMYARALKTGKLVWRQRARGAEFASQPAVSGRRVYFTSLNGSVRALDCFTGHRVWIRRGIGPTESSPLIVGDRLYFGDWYGNVYALDKVDGRVLWRRNLGAKITSSPAYADGTIYIGRYAGAAYALSARNGAVRWRAGGAGDFYGTPAVAGGRVVFPNSSGGAVYCYSAENGRLLWSRSLGSYVYSSPAVWRATVYLGSYTGVFYAFDIASGAVRWSFASGGSISGAPSVVGGVVYFSNFAHRTYGLDARSGRVRWRFADGRYSPVTATEGTIVVAGHQRLYAFRARHA